MRMPTSTSRHMMVSVDTTASGTTVLFSTSTAPTRPTRDSWLLLLPSGTEEPEVKGYVMGAPGVCSWLLFLSSICCC